MNNSARARKYN